MKDQRNDVNINRNEDAERGVVVIPNIKGFSQQYSKIARKHGFKMANKTVGKVRDLFTKIKNSLGDKKE